MSDFNQNDICQWVNQQFGLMQLLATIRQSQSQCNDHECFIDDASIGSQGNASNESTFMMTAMIVFFSLMMFVLHQRGNISSKSKLPSNRNHEPNGDDNGNSVL